ncbi:MAG: signal peptide peptidase SppA [Alphaproteobacteria bacterium]
MSLLRRLTLLVLLLSGGLTTLFVCGLLLLLAASLWQIVPEPLPDRFILTVDLRDGVAEQPALAGLPGGGEISLIHMVLALEAAADDPRVTGLFAIGGGTQLGPAQVDELREAVLRFRRSGKPTALHAESFETNGTRGYTLATAFDEIWMQPSGMVAITGFRLEQIFVQGALAWAGLKGDFITPNSYKGGAESLTRSDFSILVRINLERFVQSDLAHASGQIASARRIAPSRLESLIGRAPVIASNANVHNLVDRLGYRDQALGALHRRTDGPQTAAEVETGAAFGTVPTVTLDAYASHLEADSEAADIALIRVVGPIVAGSSGDGLNGTWSGADTIINALETAAANDAMRAIIVRIDSPGGSYSASDAIWHAMRQAARTKPVVVSMADTAASGGYFIALGADHVIANPATLTGSIGIFAGKIHDDGLGPALGLTIDGVQAGTNADLWSPAQAFTLEGRQRISEFLSQAYDDFTDKLIAARHIDPEEVRSIADGRIWTGLDARRHGLVDALGGIHEAMTAARRLAGLPASGTLRLVDVPPPATPLQALLSLLDRGSSPFGLLRAAVLQTLGLPSLPAATQPAGERLLAAPAFRRVG